MSPLWTATLCAAGAAFAFAASNALRHRSAADLPPLRTLQLLAVGRFSLRMLRHPVWLAGMAADSGGIALHALALHNGPLTLVQPVLVSGLLFALPLRRWLDRRPPSRRELAWAGVLTVALVVFLLVATPRDTGTSSPDVIPAVVATVALALALVACVVVWRLAGGTVGAAALGVAAGLATAATAALLKSTTNAVGQPGGLLSAWPLYPLLAVGLASILLNQIAFQAGPLGASLPAINTVDPIVSMAIGILVYDEPLRGGAPAIGVEVVALAIVVAAAFALAKTDGPAAVEGKERPERLTPEDSRPRRVPG